MRWSKTIMVALGIASAAAGIAGTAEAQPVNPHAYDSGRQVNGGNFRPGVDHARVDRVETVHTVVRVNNGRDGYRSDNRRWNRGRHNGWNNQRHCTTQWRHHRRVRRCW